MSKLKSLALAAIAAGAIFTAGSVAAPSQAEARHGVFGGGFRGHGFVGGHRFVGGPRFIGGHRFIGGPRFVVGPRFIYRPWAYRVVRPRIIVAAPVVVPACRVVYRTNALGYIVPVRLCPTYRTYY